MSRLILCTLLMVTLMILIFCTRVSELQLVSTIDSCFLSLTARTIFFSDEAQRFRNVEIYFEINSF